MGLFLGDDVDEPVPFFCPIEMRDYPIINYRSGLEGPDGKRRGVTNQVPMVIIDGIKMVLIDNNRLMVMSVTMNGLGMRPGPASGNDHQVRSPGTIAIIGLKGRQGDPADVGPGMDPGHPSGIPG